MRTETAFSLDRKLIGRIEDALALHRSFVRRARDRAQNMLFFYGLCRDTDNAKDNEAIASYRTFCAAKIGGPARLPADHQAEVAALLDELARRLDPERPDGEGHAETPGDLEKWLERIGDAARRNDWQANSHWRSARNDYRELWACCREIDRWKGLPSGSSLGSSGGPWSEARKAVEDFLSLETASYCLILAGQADRQIPFLRGLAHFLRNLPGWAQKHLAAAAALVLGGYVLFGVEAVSSLLGNMRWWAILPFFLASLPWLVAVGWRLLRFRNREDVPFWDVGGSPHRSWVPLARAPGRLYQRWPRDVGHPGTGRLWRPDERLREAFHGVREAFRRSTRPQSIQDVIIKGQLLRVAWSMAGWLMGTVLFWWLVSIHWLDSTDLTALVIVIVLFALVLTGRLVDFWDFLDPYPVRLILLGCATLGLIALHVGWGQVFFMVAFACSTLHFFFSYARRPGRPLRLVLGFVSLFLLAATTVAWIVRGRAVWREPAQANAWRKDSPVEWPFPGTDPVVVMAASGGGSRAALYTALTLEKLDRLAVPCSDPDGSCTIGGSLQAISSVSGGSLANAGYVVRRLAERWSIDVPDGLSDAVSRDFLRSTLSGAFNQLQSRGDSLEAEWQGSDRFARGCPQGDAARWKRGGAPRLGTRGMALGETCLSDLARAWSDAAGDGGGPPFPVPLFNTTTLDGHDLVITPLAPELYTSTVRAEALHTDSNRYYRDPEATWVFYRDTMYALEDLLGPDFDALLSSSVRASANFPFGFPLVEVETHRRLFLRPGWTQRCPKRGEPCEAVTIQLTDGGALSNSGMWSLFRLLLDKRRALRDRGVLLVVVEASKMPEAFDFEGSFFTLSATIGDQAPIGQYLHRTMLELLEDVFGSGIAVTQIDLEPTKSMNVLTTWALDSSTRARLEGVFERRWNEECDSLVAKWSYLQRRSREPNLAPPPGLDLIDRSRPPVD